MQMLVRRCHTQLNEHQANTSPGPDPNFVWIATGYTLAIGVSCLIWGRLSDIFGRRWFFIGGNALASIGSILGATGQNITTVIWCQVFIGLAFPAQLSFSVALAELIPNSYRGYMNGVLFLVAMPFSTFGPVIARLLQENTSQGWRWAYYMNLILVGLSMILAFFCYHPPDFERLHTRVTKTKVVKNLDYIGIILFTAAIALTLTGLNWGGIQYPWKSGQTLGTLIGGLALLISFIFWGEFLCPRL
jgi:MFS family permease